MYEELVRTENENNKDYFTRAAAYIKWNCQEKCSRINSLNSFSTYAARSSSCSIRYTAGGYPPGLAV